MRFIQVGVGGFGKRWVQTLANESRAEVVGLIDIDENALKHACDMLGFEPPCYHSLQDALDNAEADALICVTPPQLHPEQVIAALNAGLHVISEKPMADSITNCNSMLDASRETGKTYVVSQNYRFRPAVATLARQVGDGLIGEIGQVQIDFYKGFDFGGGFRHSMEYPVLIDMGIHHLDLLRYVTGLNAVAVTGNSWNPVWSNYRGDCSSSVMFEMENGAHCLYNASWCAKGDFCDWDGNWHIEGSEGTLTYSRGEITLYRSEGLYKTAASQSISIASMEKTDQAFVLSDFIDCLSTNRRPLTNCFDNIQSIEMVFAAVEAVRSGEKQPITKPKETPEIHIGVDQVQ